MKTILTLTSLLIVAFCQSMRAEALDYSQAAEQINKKQYRTAIESLTKLMKENPKDAKLFVSRGQAYHDCHRLDKALIDYSEAIKLEPTNSANYVFKADALLELKKYKEAENNAFRAKELDPSSATAFVVYGSALRSQGLFKQAIAAYDQALAITPEYVRAKNERALCQRSKSKLK
jgi:tetratricopeptide (TPR) repeat protein